MDDTTSTRSLFACYCTFLSSLFLPVIMILKIWRDWRTNSEFCNFKIALLSNAHDKELIKISSLSKGELFQ